MSIKTYQTNWLFEEINDNTQDVYFQSVPRNRFICRNNMS